MMLPQGHALAVIGALPDADSKSSSVVAFDRYAGPYLVRQSLYRGALELV